MVSNLQRGRIGCGGTAGVLSAPLRQSGEQAASVEEGQGRPPPRYQLGVLRFPVLLQFRFSRILKGMEVHFSPDVETRLQELAFAHGKDAEQLVKDTVARMLETQARFIAGVQKGIEQADRGEFVEHKDVLNRIDRLFQS